MQNPFQCLVLADNNATLMVVDGYVIQRKFVPANRCRSA